MTNKDKRRTLIIIPVFNEAENIFEVIADVRNHCGTMDIVVIDDGSRDTTAQEVMRAGCPLINLPFNLGIGGAMQTGYKYAYENGYDIAIQFDGDGQHRADQVQHVVEPIMNDEADMVIGSRFREKGRYRALFARLVAIKTLSRIISFLCSQQITDATSGFRAANRKVIEFFGDIYPDDYPEPEVLVILHKAGFRLKEVPVYMRQRRGGKTSITPVRSLYYMIKVLLAIMIDMIKRIPKMNA